MPREERERRYVAEYAAELLPPGTWATNTPLGPIPDEIISRFGLSAGAALMRPSRPRVDLVHWRFGKYYLIECKIREPRDAIGNLLVYKSLAEKTLDLPGYTGQPIVLRLVVPWILDWVQATAEGYGMEVVVFLRPWIEDYVRERQNYFTRESRIERDEKMRLRKTLGLE